MSGKKVATHSKAKNESTPGKRTPAKRPIDKEDQNSTPKRRRCLSIKRNIHPESSEDPNKTAPLDELVPDREKIPLPVTLNVIETVDLRIQHLTPLCAPICPANVPLDTIVKDFLVHKKFISPNQKATPQKITHHAWGISEMVRIFNENIRSHVLTTSEIKEFDKKRANALKRYGVIHLLRMISKLHEINIRLSIYEDIKGELPEFLKFINDNYKKYWNREAEYSIDKHSFEVRTGILLLKRDI